MLPFSRSKTMLPIAFEPNGKKQRFVLSTRGDECSLKLCFLVVSEEAERESLSAGFASHPLFLSTISAKRCFLSPAKP